MRGSKRHAYKCIFSVPLCTSFLTRILASVRVTLYIINAFLEGGDVIFLVSDCRHKAGISVDVIADYLEAPVGKPHPVCRAGRGGGMVSRLRMPRNNEFELCAQSPVFALGAVGRRFFLPLIVSPKYSVGVRLLLSHRKVEIVLQSKSV